MRLGSALGTETPMCRGGEKAAESPPYPPSPPPQSPPLAANRLTSDDLICNVELNLLDPADASLFGAHSSTLSPRQMNEEKQEV